MGEREIADNPHGSICFFGGGKGGFASKDEVVVGEHHALRHACGSACVDQSCTVTRLDPFHSLLQLLSLAVLAIFSAQSHELCPTDNSSLFAILDGFSIYDNLINTFPQQSKVLLCVLNILCNYHSTL